SQLRAPRSQIGQLATVLLRTLEAQFGDIYIAERKFKAIAKLQQRAHVELLLLMRSHARFLNSAHAVSFFRLGQDDGRTASVGSSRVERSVKLAKIVATAFQRVDFARGHMCDQRPELGI